MTLVKEIPFTKNSLVKIGFMVSTEDETQGNQDYVSQRKSSSFNLFFLRYFLDEWKIATLFEIFLTFSKYFLHLVKMTRKPFLKENIRKTGRTWQTDSRSMSCPDPLEHKRPQCAQSALQWDPLQTALLSLSPFEYSLLQDVGVNAAAGHLLIQHKLGEPGGHTLGPLQYCHITKQFSTLPGQRMKNIIQQSTRAPRLSWVWRRCPVRVENCFVMWQYWRGLAMRSIRTAMGSIADGSIVAFSLWVLPPPRCWG